MNTETSPQKYTHSIDPIRLDPLLRGSGIRQVKYVDVP